MIKSIIENPYRILGVYANSPKKEQVANKTKIVAFSRVGKSMPFPLDLKGILPDINRTQELIDKADSQLSLAEGQLQAAQFWFFKITPIDDIAFNHILAGNLDAAIEIWRKSVNMSSLNNLFVAYLIKEDFVVAINDFAIPLYRDYISQFVSTISATATIDDVELIDNIIDSLANSGVDILKLSSQITDEKWKSHFDSKIVTPLLNTINSAISISKGSRKSGPEDSLKSGKKLMEDTKDTLNSLAILIGKDDRRFQMVSDKLAQEILQCGIDYYNETDDFYAPKKCIELYKYALSVAMGSMAKDRCKSNLETIQEAYDKMPPVEVSQEARKLNLILDEYYGLDNCCSNAIWLLKKTSPILGEIKDKLGQSNSYYLETCSDIGNLALGDVIDEVNKAQKDEEPSFDNFYSGLNIPSTYAYLFKEESRRKNQAKRLKEAFANAWNVIVILDLLDKNSAFASRYLKNKNILYNMISKLQGFNHPDGNHIIQGCCYGIKADKKFFWSQNDYFEKASSISELKEYLRLFPNGVYRKKIQDKIDKKKRREKTIYILIAIIIAISVLIAVVANASNSKSSTGANGPAQSEEIVNPYYSSPNGGGYTYDSEESNDSYNYDSDDNTVDDEESYNQDADDDDDSYDQDTDDDDVYYNNYDDDDDDY